MFNIVLLNPEIPQNTGNIVRTAAATGARVHLIRPLGFEVTDKHLKRAGLDYWHLTEIFYYDGFTEFLLKMKPGPKLFFASTKAGRVYTDADLSGDTYVVFGPESRGVPEDILKEHYNDCIRIPQRAETRSLNLSNAVAVVVYEAMRQNGFSGLLLHRRINT